MGNGSSLNDVDLDLMAGEESYACNSINRIYDRTSWRPTRIFWGDLYNSDNYEDILHHIYSDYDSYLSQRVADQLAPDHPVLSNVSTYDICSEHLSKNPPVDYHTHQGMYCRYGGTLQVALSHALDEGYDLIYLVGVDLGHNYFDPDYQRIPATQEHHDRSTTMWAYMHGLARLYCDKRGVRIYNATAGGQLEAYERVDFDRLF